MYSDSIQFYKWETNKYKELFNSFKEFINIKSLQFYMPVFSLYFYIHNKPNATKKMDLKRNFYIQNFKEVIKERYYNSNMILKGEIYNSSKNIIENKDIFCKCMPILDSIHCINNNYNILSHNNHHLPSTYNYNTFKKINDIDNTAYIDVFFSFIASELYSNKINPSFPLYYGSFNGIGDYKYDITDEYHDIKIDKCFNEMIDKSFKLKVYLSDSDGDDETDGDDGDDGDNSDNSENSESDDSSKNLYYNEDYIATIQKIPVQYLFIERLKGTLEDLILENITQEVLLSCIFQVSFALTYLQKHFKFTHNDLHINNIMYSDTETKYLYYKYNNIYYRVPTHGKIFKIIDFGRCIFTYHNKVFLNDVFSDYGEAGGQYTYPNQVNYLLKNNEKDIILPNYNFDLCRLSMTILEELNFQNYSGNFIQFMNLMCLDKDENSFRNMSDDFRLYINIAKYSCNSLPRKIITNDIFNEYRIKKKLFPRKSYYTI